MTICCCATTDVHLQAWIRANGTMQPCDRCGSADQPTVPATALAERIYQVVGAHYQPHLEDPASGEEASDVIQRRAGVDAGMARSVAQVARDRDPGHSGLYN